MFSSILNITWFNSSHHENNLIIEHTSSLTIIQRIIFILSIVSEFMKVIQLLFGNINILDSTILDYIYYNLSNQSFVYIEFKTLEFISSK
jgi:hypothetical protein